MLKLTKLLPVATCLLCQGTISASKLCLCDACVQDLPAKSPQYSCQRCGHRLQQNGASLCGNCQNRLPYFDHTISLFEYLSPVDHLIQELKFNNNLLVADTLGKLLAQAILQQADTLPDAIIPIPLHTKRLRQRGYNQALQIAKPIAHALKIPLTINALVRRKHSKPQTECDAKERRKNLRDIFQATDNISFKSVALIDDVITTGTTVNEAAKALKQQGIKTVQVWACAQSMAPK